MQHEQTDAGAGAAEAAARPRARRGRGRVPGDPLVGPPPPAVYAGGPAS